MPSDLIHRTNLIRAMEIIADDTRSAGVLITGHGEVENDDWHTVGDPGEPAFTAGWGQYVGAPNPFSYRKTANGYVQFRGCCVPSSGHLSAGATIFTIPIDYWPFYVEWQTAFYEDDGTNAPRVAVVRFMQNGAVGIQNAQPESGSSTGVNFVCFDGKAYWIGD